MESRRTEHILLKSRIWHIAQAAILFGGTVFAWLTLYTDFSRFYETEGTLFKIADCVYPNPVTTACFYGAFAFLAAFVWSLYILRQEKEKQTKHQTYLMWLLLAGALFAWSNFGIQLFDFYENVSGSQVSCSGVPTSNPFLTPCFYGSVIFLIAFALSIVITRRDKHINTENIMS